MLPAILAVAALVAALLAYGALSAQAATGWRKLISSYDYDPSPSACAAYLFIGVRGSGEPAKDSDSPLGPTIATYESNLKKATPTADVRPVYLDYQASGMNVLTQDIQRNKDALLSLSKIQPLSKWNYFVSVQQGTLLLRRLLDQSFASCPTQKVIVAGYSQGALVTSSVLSQAKYSKPANYAGIELVADPANSPTRPEINQGTAPASALGIWSYVYGQDAVTLPLAMAGKVYSYCDRNDFVCDTSEALAKAKADLPRHPVQAIKAALAGYATGRNIHGAYVKDKKFPSAVTPIAGVLNAAPTMPSLSASASPSTSVVSIPDASLKACIITALGYLGITTTAPTAADMAKVQEVTCSYGMDGSGRINSLEGLQYATSLTLFHTQSIQGGVTDLTPVASLPKLTDLSIDGAVNNASLVALENNATITKLALTDGTLTDVSPLASMKALKTVDLSYNYITDLRPLKSIPEINAGGQAWPGRENGTAIDSPAQVGVSFALPQIYAPTGEKLQPFRPSYTLDGTIGTDSVTWSESGAGQLFWQWASNGANTFGSNQYFDGEVDFNVQ